MTGKRRPNHQLIAAAERRAQQAETRALLRLAQKHIWDLEAEVAELKAQLPRWISVDERLPEIGKRVFVLTADDLDPSTDIRIQLTDDWAWATFDGQVTHWCNYPPLPVTIHALGTGLHVAEQSTPQEGEG